MKKVLLIFRAKAINKPKAIDFANRINDLMDDDAEVVTAEISELLFDINGDKTKITHPVFNFDIKDFDLVIIRHIGLLDAEAHAVAVYCRVNNIKCIDSYLDRIIDDKVSAAFEHWVVGAPLPRTIYGRVEDMAKKLPELGEKAIFKDNRGHKGLINYVVTSAEEMFDISAKNPEISFLLQEFIPNDFDYRVLVLNYKSVLVIKRSSSSASHLNNTSQGGKAELIPIKEIDPEILKVSEKVSRAEKLEVAGVDIIVDKTDPSKYYVLEVNHAPQISSGTFLSEKAYEYAKMIKGMLQ